VAQRLRDERPGRRLPGAAAGLTLTIVVKEVVGQPPAATVDSVEN